MTTDHHRKPLSPVLRLFFVNWLLGIGLGVAFAAALLWLDIAGLRTLILRSDMAGVALALLFGGFAITCGAVVCGSAIMRLPSKEEDNASTPPGSAAPAGLVPVRVRACR